LNSLLMELDWVKVCEVPSLLEAKIVRNKLLENEIPSTEINKQDSMHIHLNHSGSIEIYVAKDNAFKAVQLLNSGDH